jgi:spore germination protein KB
MNIIQYSELLLGRIVGKIVGLLYIWLFLHVSADAVRVCGEYFTTAPMPETPLLVFLLTIVLVTAYAAYNGLEVVARMSEIIMPLILLAVLIIGFLVFKEIEFKNLKPVLEDGILPVFHGAVTSASRGIEPLLLAMLSPYLNDKKRKTVSYVIALSVFTIILTIIDIQILTSLGANQAKVFTFPYINLMRRINFADIIERIELIYIGIWLLGVILKVSLYFYLAALGSAQLFNLKSYKPIVLPVGVIIVLLSVFLYRNLVQMSEFFSYKILTPYNLFFILVIPLFLLMVSFIRGINPTKTPTSKVGGKWR